MKRLKWVKESAILTLYGFIFVAGFIGVLNIIALYFN